MPEGVLLFLFQLLILLFSVIIHEVSHGFIAERLGDPTARLMGRLTLNPAKHIDPFGSIVLPLIMAIPIMFGQPSIIFGWAKPVPYDPLNLRKPVNDSAKIAAAGPISNILIAGIFGMFLQLADAQGFSQLIGPFSMIIYTNIVLAVFNLVPIPPLDGSKILFALLPDSEMTRSLVFFLEQYGMMLLLAFVFFGFDLIRPLIQYIFVFLVGGFF